MQAVNRAPSAPGPRPVNVRYNDWRQVALPPPEAFTPSLSVSVVMPCYRTPPAVLARTLAALESQTYPRALFEVVIVDDGSRPPLAPPRSSLNVRVVRQVRRGRGIARARNNGARAAAYDILLFLDGDSLPEAGWMAAHARWHHAVSDVLTLGFRAHVAVDDVDPETIRHRSGTLREMFENRPLDPPWVEPYMQRTKDMTTPADDLFHCVVGGNFGISRAFYQAVGGNEESFTSAHEDCEFAWRVYTRGGLLVPVRAAFAWHQGRWSEGREAKQRSRRFQREKPAHLIPHPRFRSIARGRIYKVPRYVVTLETARCPVEQVAEATRNILADREHDLVVRIEIEGSEDAEQLVWLHDAFDPDPRVRVAPGRPALDEFPAAPFHVRLPANIVAKNLVHRLHGCLGSAVYASSYLPDGTRISIARAWALHRVRRAGGSPADFGDVREIAPSKLKLRVATPLDAMGVPTRWKRLLQRARDIQNLSDVWSIVWRIARWWRPSE